jgi:type II secretory pathway component PulM
LWMIDSDKRIQQLESHNTQAPTKTLSSLLSRVQTDLNQNPLQKNIAQLQQADNDSIEIRFQHANFDNILRWAITLCRQQQLTVTDMMITPGTAAGIVDATLKLKAG